MADRVSWTPEAWDMAQIFKVMQRAAVVACRRLPYGVRSMTPFIPAS